MVFKTAVRQVIISQSDLTFQTKADIAKCFEEAIVETLVVKAQKALIKTGLKRLVVAGGVGANIYLRKQLNNMVQTIDAKVYYPRHSLCTDNGAMVAYAGYLRFEAGQSDDLAVHVRARWPLEELNFTH